jgi:protein SCO1/2
MSRFRVPALAIALLAWPAVSLAHDTSHHNTATEPPPEMRLPVIGPAPDFDLTSQDGKRVTLADFRGKVIAVTFIFTNCPDICPTLTLNLAQVQAALGSDFGKIVAFVSITVDPEIDTPPVLREYAEAFDADLGGWAFLTGDPASLHNIATGYGVFAEKAVGGSIDHTLLTSIVDPKGMIRVQYIGYRFDLEEFRGDLLSLVGEAE